MKAFDFTAFYVCQGNRRNFREESTAHRSYLLFNGDLSPYIFVRIGDINDKEEQMDGNERLRLL